MATLTSSLIVTLLDRVTAPARAAANAIRGIGQAAAAANSGGLAAMAERNTQALARMQASMLAATAAAYGLYKGLASPLGVAGKFETILLDIAQKSDLSDAAMKAMGDRIRALAPIVNKTAQEVASGIDVLTSMGLDPTRALAISPMLGKAASAYRAEMTDVAKMTFAAIDNLKVPVSETAKLLDVLSQASKEGAFEFKDMAREFPAIAASAQALGQKGVIGAARIAAALETIRKGTGSSAEAATDLQNVFQKITSPETTKNFAKLGIDIRAQLKKTMAEGGDVMEMLAANTMKALGGDLTKLGDLFQDKQVQEGLRAFIQNWAEYRRIREAALKASGVVDTDFDRRMKTFEAQVEAFRIKVNELGITIGTILMPHVNRVLDVLKPMVERLQAFAEAHPKLVAGIVKLTAGLVVFRIAAIAARGAMLFLTGAVLAVARPVLAAAVAMATLTRSMLIAPVIAGVTGAFRLLTAAVVATSVSFRTMSGMFMLLSGGALLGTLRTGIAGLGAAMLGLLKPLALVRGAMHLLMLAVIRTGIGAVLVAIAAAGIFIYENWAGLGEFFTAFGQTFMAALGPLASVVQPLINGVKALWETVSGFFGEISPATWQQWGASAGAAVGAAAVAILELPSRISSLSSQLYNGAVGWMSRMRDGIVEGVSGLAGTLYDVGVGAMDRLWEGLKSRVAAIKEWFAGIINDIVPESVRSLVVPATPAPKTTPDRPQRAQPRVAGNPDEPSVAPEVPSQPAPAVPLMLIGRSEAPAGAIPQAAPDVDVSQIEAMSIAAANAGTSLQELNGTVTPQVDTAPLQRLLELARQAKSELREIGGMTPAMAGAAGGRLQAGGGVRRAVDGEHSDYGNY